MFGRAVFGNFLRTFRDPKFKASNYSTQNASSSSGDNSSSIKTDEVVDIDDDNDMPKADIVNPFEKEAVKCILCQHNVKVDWKNVRLLSQFVSPYTGRVYGRHITRLCAQQQDIVEREIMKAQDAGLMGYYTRHLDYCDDPKLFNPEQPIRNHRF